MSEPVLLDDGPRSQVPSDHPGPGRVLLVDDEEAILGAYARILSAAGLKVDTAATGEGALDLLARNSYDAVLSDIKMSGMGGIEFLRAVRARNLDVPVLLMTGEPSVNSAAQALELGALQYLLKPIDRGELEATMLRAVRLHRFTLAKLKAVDLTGSDAIRVTDQQGLEGRLDSALSSLWLAFHPVFEARGGGLYGHEALLRSEEPALPNPKAVLEVAERLGRLADVGRAVRARAAECLGPLQDDSTLFVNLHAQDLEDPELVDRDAPLTSLSHRVVLELTERACLRNSVEVKARVSELKALGFRIAIDDIGAGYAGLSNLTLLEPNFAKLDVSLVRDVHRNRTKQRLIRSMVELARDLGILTVAEGVETEGERDQLIEIGCDLMQGFLFALPSREFTRPH